MSGPDSYADEKYIRDQLAFRGLGQVTDDQGQHWYLKLTDGTGVIITHGDEPFSLIGDIASWDWYCSHVSGRGAYEIGGGNGNFEIVLAMADDYIREPGWDRVKR